MAWSIHTRQIVVVGALLAIFIAITGLSIDYANQSVAHTATESYLRGQLYSLISATSIDDETQQVSVKNSIDPRFYNIDTGLYSLIVDDSDEVIWQSNSSVTLNFDNVDSIHSGDSQLFETIELTDNILDENNQIKERPLLVNHLVYSAPVTGSDRLYSFHVAENVTEQLSRLGQFRYALWFSLVALSLFLMISLGLAIRWSLRPLRQMSDRVEEINRGEAERIEGRPVREIIGLTERLNKLLDSEQVRRERFKNSLGDLAHSLKTPLAVMQSEADSKGKIDTQTVSTQLQRMREIVDYQLRRASLAGRAEFLERIDLTAIINQLSTTLKKVYHERNIEFRQNLPGSQPYPIEKGDLMEILGNVMDNACKYGNSIVRIRMSTEASPNSAGRAISISIEDDGRGIDSEARKKIMQRGYRIDETRHSQPGQGIGLALASDILDSYGGVLHVGESPLGGARFIIYFPVVD